MIIPCGLSPGENRVLSRNMHEAAERTKQFRRSSSVRLCPGISSTLKINLEIWGQQRWEEWFVLEASQNTKKGSQVNRPYGIPRIVTVE
jgi:hypothetical protein